MIAINDPAGTAIAFTKAINKYTDHNCRLITKESRYNHLFEKDLHLPWLDNDGWNEVEQLLKDSDIFHFHMTADESIELGPFRPVDYLKGKIIVHHHHGHEGPIPTWSVSRRGATCHDRLSYGEHDSHPSLHTPLYFPDLYIRNS